MVFISVCLLFTACKKDEIEEVDNPADHRTVLIYVAGENTLSKFFVAELAEIIAGSRSMQKGDHLLVYIDVADKFHNPYLLDVSQGDTVTIHQYTQDSYAGDPAVMSEVINRAFSAYPAGSYGLVLWGHASGWIVSNDSVAHSMMARRLAYGIDNGENRGDDYSNFGYEMNIPTLKKTIQRCGYPLKFIFGDCCNFMCAEVAYELRQTADYIIGSSAEIPGKGAPYKTMVPAMFSRSDTFYKEMVDAYYEQIVNGDRVPLAVVKTSEMDQLAAATRTTLKAIKASQGDNFLDLSELIYYSGKKGYPSAHVMYDMNDIMLRYAADGYNSWKQSFDKAVVYSKMAPRWNTNGMVIFQDFAVTDERYGGLSMFVPQPDSFTNYYQYNRDITKLSWYYAAEVDVLQP